MHINRYNTQIEALEALSQALAQKIAKQDRYKFNLALSGGESARLLFNYWSEHCSTLIPWHRIRFFWVDERCVSPSDPESNFKLAYDLLFTPLHIPEPHYFRIMGEQDPVTEARRYSILVSQHLSHHNSVPQFDCILLGVGLDLHTASLFPAQRQKNTENLHLMTSIPNLMTTQRLYAASIHPVSHQQRITMTAPFILNNTSLLVPLLGEQKAELVEKLSNDNTPAGYILNQAKRAIIFVGTA